MQDSYLRIKGLEYNMLDVEAKELSVQERERHCKVVREALQEVFPNADVLVTSTEDPERIYFITDGSSDAELWVQEYGDDEVRSIGRVAWEQAAREYALLE